MSPAFVTLARCLNLAWRTLTRPSEALPSAAAGKEPTAELAILVIVFVSVFVGTGAGLDQRSLTHGLAMAAYAVVLNGIILFLQVYTIFFAARRLGWKDGTSANIFNGYAPAWSASLVAVVLTWYPTLSDWPWMVLGIHLAAQVWQWGLMVLGIRQVLKRSTWDALEACLPAIVLVDVPILAMTILSLVNSGRA